MTPAEPIRSCRSTPSAVPGPRRSCQALQISSSRLGRAPGILMRLCPNREHPGARAPLPGHGVRSAAAPRHSPAASASAARHRRPSGGGGEGRPHRRRAKEMEAFPLTPSRGTLLRAEFSHSQALGSGCSAVGLIIQHPAQPEM